jgi:predicted regulator of Ras-like GTPase activity (Roadblock/LC7/MglB family)
MIVETLAVISGGLIGFSITWKLVEKGIKEEEMKVQEVQKAKVSVISEAIAKKEETTITEPKKDDFVPTSLSELVDHLRDKYMLYDVTILTPEGLPIASNSETPDEDAAMAPELLKVARRMFNTDKVTISSEKGKLIVLQASPEIILHARTTRDLPEPAIERLKNDTERLLEGII